MALTSEDLLAIAGLMDTKNVTNNETIFNQIRKNSNLILSELDKIEQNMYKRFNKVDQHMQHIREDIHTTKYSNETVELLLKKVTELEKRIADIEKSA